MRLRTAAAACIASALAALAVVPLAGAAHTRHAAGSLAGRTLQLRYCWSTATFNPRCPLASLPLSANGTVNNMPGSSWSETATTVVIDFVNPSATVTRTTSSGSLTSSSGPACFAGTMVATRTIAPAVMTGVWQGCAA